MTDKKISIIIPCYNVEKYIVNCLDSIIAQLKKFEYEIILVNDCSKDATDAVIKKYIKKSKKDNIIYINNKENIGAGASRNKAIKIAKYDVISFIDADDYIDENYYEEMYRTMIKEKADFVCCDIVMVDENDGTKTRISSCEFVPSKYNIINTGLSASPCNKLIKKEYLIKYPFAEGIMNEDVCTVIAIIANCNKVSYTSDTCYYYLQHASSVQNSGVTEKRLDIIKSVDILESRIKGNSEYDDFMSSVIFHQLVSFLLYVPIKEKHVVKRAKFLKKFGNRTKKFKLRQNRMYWNFLERQKFSTKIFYKTYMKLTCNGFGFMASLWLLIYTIYKALKIKKPVIKQNISIEDIIEAIKKNQKCSNKKTVSVAIPNYNYSKFLYERLYSIFNQKYKINELIFLDDCSTDDSREKFDSIEKKIKKLIKVKKIYNKNNSGSVFKQWQKAMKNCESDYIWIAEADDYCDERMLKSLMNLVNKNENIRIAYVDTAFIDKEGNIVLKTIKPEIDIMKTGHWNHNFINDGVEEIKNYAYLNCTIANVSSVIFKNDDYSEIFDELGSYKQVGDYLFYLSLMAKGKIAFVNKPLNYYRLHGSNVTSMTKKQLHFDELKKVHSLLDDKYGLTKKQKEQRNKRYEFLERVWGLNEKK